MQISMFAPEIKKETPKQKFCRLANKHFPIKRWMKIVETAYYGDKSQGGRTRPGLGMMLRIIVIKHFYNLSEVACEAEILENLTFRDFCLVDGATEIPDNSTIGRFNKWLVDNGYFSEFFESDVACLKVASCQVV